MKRTKAVHGDGTGALTPSFFPDSQSELQQLRAENRALRHSCHELNKLARFLVKTLGQPLTPRQETRAGRHGR